MEGRRVERRRKKKNPLFSVFVAMFIAVLALLALSIFMGIKLKAANKQLTIAEMKLAQYEQQKTEKPEREAPSIGGAPSENIAADEPAAPEPPEESTKEPTKEPEKTTKTVGWLDLTGHKEVQVAPESVFDKYSTCYTTDGVNLRSGPGTSYSRVKLVSLGTQVKAAAESGNWTFVNADGQFGWIKSDYLSATKPEPKQAETEKKETKPAEQKPTEEIIASPGQIGY